MLKQLLLLIAITVQTVCAQPKTKITVTDLTRIKSVGGIKVAPGGQRALYTLTTIEPAADQKPDNRPDEYEYKTHIYLTNLKPGEAKALTHGTESARQATWSPDGRQIAFVRNVKGKPQVFVMPLDGGEAWQLTTGPYAASGPKWSPDGKRIAFTVNVTMGEMLKDSVLNPGKKTPAWSLEKPGFSANDFVLADKKIKPNPDGSLAEIRAYLDKDVEDKKVKVINRLNLQGESTTEPELGFAHLYITDAQEGATAKPLTRGFTSFQTYTWLPNGQGLLAVSDRDSLKHPDREQDNAIVFIPADGSRTRTTVLAEAGKSYGAPEVSPDGRQLAFLVSASAGVSSLQIGLATLNGPTASNTQLITFDRAATSLTWATAATPAKSKKATTSYALYFIAAANGGIPLYQLNPATRQVTQLTGFESGITGFDIVGNQLVFAKTEVANPSELYTYNLAEMAKLRKDVEKQPMLLVLLLVGGKEFGKLTTHNDWVAQKQLSEPEKRTYKNSIGQTVDYWIMRPAVVNAGRKYPLLLNMHGGPTAMWGPGEPSMWHELQYMCAQGYGVVYANPRGSGGYGLNFQRANINDWGTGPTEDVLAAATDAAKEAWVDTSRQVITGGSYAGYLTAWIVAHDNRFKAAFAQRGVYDLTTFMGEGNAWRLVPAYFGGYPWQADAKKVLDANSPYTFVENIRTPLLIKHGENDLRTGIIQSEMLYKSLKILGRPVEYVRVPGATHELSRSGNVRQRIDRLLRIYEFFERYVGSQVQTSTVK